jgi:lambda repressor-like predicted transcriptional regulator
MGINLKNRSKLWLAGGASVLALGVVGGAAIAAGDGGDGPRAERAAAVSDYLGLPSEDIRDARQGGTSLAQLADQQGVSVDGLEAVIVADASEHLDEAIADGRISEERAEDMLSQFEERVAERVQSTDAPERDGRRGGGAIREAVSSYLDTPVEEIKEQRQNGTSLAQIAESEGKSADGLEQAIIAAAQEKTTDAVESGRLTQAEADERLSELKSSVSEMIQSTDAPERGHHGPGGPGGPGGPDGSEAEGASATNAAVA